MDFVVVVANLTLLGESLSLQVVNGVVFNHFLRHVCLSSDSEVNLPHDRLRQCNKVDNDHDQGDNAEEVANKFPVSNGSVYHLFIDVVRESQHDEGCKEDSTLVEHLQLLVVFEEIWLKSPEETTHNS